VADKIGEIVVEVGADARDFNSDAERGIEKSLKKIGKRIERAAEKWAREMRDSVKDALDGLVLQVNAKIDPKDLRRIETAIASTKASPEVTISARELEEIKQKLRRAEWRTPVKPVLDDNAVAKMGRELDEMKAAIKARVDLDEVSRKHALEAIRKTEAEIDAKVDIKGQDIAELKEKIANIKSEVKVDASLEKATQRKIREQIAKLDAKLKAEAELDDASKKKLQAELKKLGGDIEAHAHLSEASKRKLKHELGKLDGKATVNADLDDGKARFDLKRLTAKPRYIDIHVRLAKASLAKVAAELKALAGGNIFGNLKNSLNDIFTNLDTFSVKMASVGTAVLGLTSVMGAGLGTISQFGVGIAHSLPALLALPGIMAAAGAGIGIFVVAMKDASTVLEDLGPQFTALQESISLNFWGEAEDAVRNLAVNALEALSPVIADVSAEMGMMTAAVADVATDHIPGFQASLGYLAEAMNIGGDGAAAFTDALLTLGETGAKYLPSIAEWANGVAYSFQNWVQAKTESGEMDKAIQSAAKTFGTLKDIVFDLAGILGGVFTAMAAGSTPLSAIADGLDRANAAVNGPLWQGTLTTIFSAMGTAASYAFQGVGSLGQAFVSLAPTLSTILPLVGQIIEVGLNGISTALQNPAFQGGLESFFQNVLIAVQALAPAMPALGEAFGALATVGGELLAAVAPLIAELVEQLAPVMTQLAALLAPIIEQLAAALMPVIQALGPVLSALFAVLGPLINDLLAAIVPAIGPIVSALSAALIPAFQLVGTTVRALMPIVVPIINIIKDTIVSAMRVIQGIINVVMGIITGNWSQAWNGIKQIGSGVWNFIKSAFTGFGAALKGIAQAAWNLLGSVISGGWNAIKSGASAAWNGIKSVVSTGVNGVVNFVKNLPNNIKSIFSSAGSWLISAGKNIIQGFINGLKSMFGSVKSTLGGLTSKLTSWKGPEPVDKVLLTPTGELIMKGFVKGLESQYGAVRSSLQSLTEDLAKPATIGLSADVQPLPARAPIGRPNPAPESPGSFDKGSRSGATINITNNYPQEKPDSKTRDEVAEGLRLAAIV
jgi:phage-related protein